MLALALHNVPIVEEEIFSPTVNNNRSYASLEEEEVAVLMTTTEMAGDDDLEKKSRPSSSSHLSITLPCKSFHKAKTQYNVTVRKYRDQFLFFCHLTFVSNNIHFILEKDCLRGWCLNETMFPRDTHSKENRIPTRRL